MTKGERLIWASTYGARFSATYNEKEAIEYANKALEKLQEHLSAMERWEAEQTTAWGVLYGSKRRYEEW